MRNIPLGSQKLMSVTLRKFARRFSVIANTAAEIPAAARCAETRAQPQTQHGCVRMGQSSLAGLALDHVPRLDPSKAPASEGAGASWPKLADASVFSTAPPEAAGHAQGENLIALGLLGQQARRKGRHRQGFFPLRFFFLDLSAASLPGPSIQSSSCPAFMGVLSSAAWRFCLAFGFVM